MSLEVAGRRLLPLIRSRSPRPCPQPSEGREATSLDGPRALQGLASCCAPWGNTVLFLWVQRVPVEYALCVSWSAERASRLLVAASAGPVSQPWAPGLPFGEFRGRARQPHFCPATGSWQNTKRAHSLPDQLALLAVGCAGHPGSQSLLPLGHEWTGRLLSCPGTDVEFSSAL